MRAAGVHRRLPSKRRSISAPKSLDFSWGGRQHDRLRHWAVFLELLMYILRVVHPAKKHHTHLRQVLHATTDGAFRGLDFFGVTPVRKRRIILASSGDAEDAVAIHDDWRTVGRDLEGAVAEYRRSEHEGQLTLF